MFEDQILLLLTWHYRRNCVEGERWTLLVLNSNSSVSRVNQPVELCHQKKSCKIIKRYVRYVLVAVLNMFSDGKPNNKATLSGGSFLRVPPNYSDIGDGSQHWVYHGLPHEYA